VNAGTRCLRKQCAGAGERQRAQRSQTEVATNQTKAQYDNGRTLQQEITGCPVRVDRVVPYIVVTSSTFLWTFPRQLALRPQCTRPRSCQLRLFSLLPQSLLTGMPHQLRHHPCIVSNGAMSPPGCFITAPCVAKGPGSSCSPTLSNLEVVRRWQ
jgi:hypothetical protein